MIALAIKRFQVLCQFYFLIVKGKKKAENTVLLIVGSELNNTYYSRNVSNNLALIMHHLLTHKQSINKHFIVLYYSQTKLSILEQELRAGGYKNIVRISPHTIQRSRFIFTDIIRYARCVAQSKYVLSSSPYERSFYKHGFQEYTVLNYYIPFKKDLVIRSKHCPIDRLFISSELGKEYICETTNVPLSKVVVETFPRVIKMGEISSAKESVMNNDSLDENIIVFAPTHRNMQNGLLDYPLYDWQRIDSWLRMNSFKLLVLPHPEANMIVDIKTNNIELLHSLNAQSTYELLAESRLLISDYSSIHFDYIYLQKPIIYFWPDFEYFKVNRGFAFNKPESYCAGPVARSTLELIGYLNEFSSNNLASYAHLRKNLFNKLYTGEQNRSPEKRIISKILE